MARQSQAPQPKPVTVTLVPPAHVVRQQAGLGLPNARQLLQAIGGVLIGAGVSATLISFARDNRWVPALLTGSLGALGVATSPIGTFISEAAMGMTAASAAWMWFDLTHQFTGAGEVFWRPPPPGGQ